MKSGRWRPRGDLADALEYTAKLEAQGKYVLTVWPFHTLLGGVSHALCPALMEAAIYHAVARDRPTHFETKGRHPKTENYSVLSPEVREVGGRSVGAFNAAFFDHLMEYDRIYVFGQAKSHCVLSTLVDMKDRILATSPASIGKVYILEDAMSPVPSPPLDPLPPMLDFPRIAERGIAELRAAGMHVVRTTRSNLIGGFRCCRCPSRGAPDDEWQLRALGPLVSEPTTGPNAPVTRRARVLRGFSCVCALGAAAPNLAALGGAMLIDRDFAELFSSELDVARTPTPRAEREESVRPPAIAERRSTRHLLREGDALN